MCSGGGHGRRRRDRRSKSINTISPILPSAPIIEVSSSYFSTQQRAFLANGPQYIPVCQSRFSRLPIDTIIEREYQQLVDAFKYGLNNNCMSATDSQAMEFFNALKNLLQQYYTKPLSARLLARGQHDHRMIISIRRIRKKQNLIIQRTDKS